MAVSRESNERMEDSGQATWRSVRAEAERIACSALVNTVYP